MPPEVREPLAAYAHDAWSGWMAYLFSKSTLNPDGTVTIPAWAVERWVRQATTRYTELPEAEKASDRAEADKMLAIITPQEGAQMPDVFTRINAFCDRWPDAEYGPAHLVLSDYNVSDYHIGYCLGCCDHYKENWGNHSPAEIAATRAFLTELLQVDEAVRLATAEAAGY